MISFKIHRQGDDVLLAVADSDLIGKKFSEKKLEITISEEFYGSEEADEKKIADLIAGATIINAMGPRAVNALVKCGIVKSGDTTKVCGLPHAQVVCV